MDAKLVVAKGKTAVKEIPLGGISTIIGRRTDCSLRIPSPLVSRQHCELTQAGNRLIVKDLGSSNGTFVNGAKIKSKELKSGDTLGVGPITFIVQIGGAAISPSDTARPRAVAAVADAGEEDVADFVVAEDIATDDAMDFVAAEEIPAEEVAEASDFVVGEESPSEEVVEASDFVVGEESAAEAVVEAADFVVGEETPAAPVEDVAEFITSDEPEPATEVAAVADFIVNAKTAHTEEADFFVNDETAGAEGTDFVAADPEIAEGETVHDVNIAEFITDDQASPPAAAEPPTEAEAAVEAEPVNETETESTKPAKKAGFFGRMFKKKDKKPASAEPPTPAPTTKTTAAPPAPIPATPTEPSATSLEDEMPEFFVQDDSVQAPNAKPVGEDEMADFLMGLNEKEE
jgi:predicted component of type VI protein secretion system